MANKVSVELSANVQGFQKGMQDATNSAKQYETETRKVSDSLGNFKKELGTTRRQVMNLAQAYSKLDAEAKNSQFGREMARQLEEAKQKAAEMIDMQGDLSQELKNLASDTRVFDTLSEGMNVFMNVTSSALGVIAMFTDDEKTARQAVVMFTTAQSALNAMTGIANALQAQSCTMLAVRKVQELATTAAIKLRTAAEGKGIIATKSATLAQKAFNIVASANPYVLLATAIIGVATACYVFASKMSDAKEKEEQAQKAAEEAKKAFEKQRETMAQASVTFVETASKIESFRDQYKKTKSELERTEILKQASKEFKNLGLEVKNLNDAQRILVQDGDKVIELLKAQGEAAAIAAIRTEMFKEKFNEIMKSGKNTVSDALRLTSYMLKDQLAQLDSEYIKLEAKASKLRSQLPQASKSTSVKSTKKSNVLDFDKGSLEDLEQQLNKAQALIKKKNLSPVDLQKALSDIDKIRKDIQKKKVELNIEPKKGSLEYIQKQISEIDNQLHRLDPKIDSAKIEELKIEKSALKEAQEEVEKALKEVEVKGKLFKSEGAQGSERYASDKASWFREKMETSVQGSDEWKQWLEKYKEWNNKALKMQVEIDAYMDDTKKGSLEWLGKEKQKYQAIFETSVVGSKEWYESLNKINELTKEEQKVQLQIDVSGMSELEKTFTALEGIHAIDDMVGSFQSLSKAIEDNASAWDIFMAAISTVESVMEGINTVVQVANTLSAIATVHKTSEAVASTAATTATATEAAAEGAAVAPATAMAVANKAAAASYLELAAAMIFAAHAYIPFAGVGIAAGLITTMLSIQAAAKATAMSLSAFAEGGIVGGSAYHGDKILARVDSGEMVLNKRQQRNLFNLLDSNTFPQAGGTNVTVQGVIHGTDLLLVQKNTNNVRRRSGTQINF